MERACHDGQQRLLAERRTQEGGLLRFLLSLAFAAGRNLRDVLAFLLLVGLVMCHVLGHVTFGGDRLLALAHGRV
jgi:hypothetical protein